MDEPQLNRCVPLSPSEERFYHQTQIYPKSGAFNERKAIVIRGRLKIDSLNKSIDAIIARHEVLRAHVLVGGDTGKCQEVLCIQPSFEFPLTVVDVEKLISQRDAVDLWNLCTEEVALPVELTSTPLFRMKLFRVSENEHVLAICMHHMISDGDPSFRIILRELSAFYEYFSGATEESPSLGTPVSRCQPQTSVDDAGATGNIGFWRQALENSEGHVNLSWKGSSTLASEDLACDTIRVTLHQDTREAVSSICQQVGVADAKPVFLALFQCVLARLTRQRDISVGMPVFCRDSKDHVRETLGYYGNVIVVRTLIEPTQTFQESVLNVQDFLETAKLHERVPFQEVVKALCPDWRSRWSTPFFNILFVLDQELDFHVTSDQTSFELTDVDLGQVAYDVVFTVRAPEAGALKVVLEYRRDLLTSSFMSTLLECFESFTVEAAQQVKQRICSIKMMPSDKARSSLLLLNRGVRVPYPRGKTVHEVFAGHVSRTPDSPAVTDCHATTLTYRELENRSNKLCCHLLSVRTEKQVPVGILMERSVEFVVAVLAVLKSGGIYVPLEPGLPLARLSLFVKKSGMRLLISQRNFKPCAERLTSVVPQLISIVPEELKCLPDAESRVEKQCSVEAEDLAYIMFTSGSTGEPKAVEIPHRAIIRLVKNTKFVKFDATTVSLLHSPLTFDASTFELWGPLCNGGRVVIAAPGKLSANDLSSFSAKQGVNLMFLASGIFNIMVDFHPENLHSIRQLVTGGDVMCPQRAAKAVKILPHCTITNGYGPTECTTFSSFYNVPESFSLTNHSVPIGRPLANTRLYVLDHDMSPVPPEATGILFIGGDGLARGYRPRDDVSNEKFVSAPGFISSIFPDETVLFRTDDLVRVLSDPGSGAQDLVVNFLGRCDTQVKVSGIRVELREVEGDVRSHNAVRDAVVVQEGERAGEKILVCYAVLLGDVQSSEIQEFLQSKIPVYMIPSKFISVCEIPLTENGKVARRHLAHTATGAQPRFHFTCPGSASPQSSLERCVASLWCEVLGIKDTMPKMEDNFFGIGGHSLLAQLAVARISTKLGVEIPLLAVFNYPTLSAFVKYLERAKATLPGLQTALPPSSSSAVSEETTSCKISQQQEEYMEVYNSGKHTAEYHISAVFSVRGKVRAQPLKQCIEFLVSEHEILRAVYETTESGETLQVILPTGRVRNPVKEQSIHPGIEGGSLHEAAERAREDICAEFDFENGPSLRSSVYYREDADETTIVLSCNHMIMDDVALWIFAREMMAHYRDVTANKALPLPRERQQYTTFIRTQAVTSMSQEFCASKEFWERELTSLPKPPLFPLSAPVSRSEGRKLLRIVTLPVCQLKKAAALLQISPFAILLAANYIAVYHVTGSSDICISFPVAARDVWNQRTIGTFARRIAIRMSSVASDVSLQDVVRDVAKNLVRVLEHQDYPMPRGNRDQLVSMFKLSYIDLSTQYLPEGALFHCLPLNSLTENLVLFLDAFADERDVHVKVCYLEGVLDDITIDALILSMEMLLRCLAHDPTTGLSRLLSEGKVVDQQKGDVVFLARDDGPVSSIGCVGELFVRVNEASARTHFLGRYENKDGNTISLMRHTSRQVEVDQCIADLGFIESIALSLDQVQDCATMVTKEGLVVFVQATSKSAVDALRTGALKSVFDELPGSQLVELSHIPLTTAGAVDTEVLHRLLEERATSDYSEPFRPRIRPVLSIHESGSVPASYPTSQATVAPRAAENDTVNPTPSTLNWIPCEGRKRSPLTTQQLVYYPSSTGDNGVLYDLVKLLGKVGFSCSAVAGGERSSEPGCGATECQSDSLRASLILPASRLGLAESMAMYLSVYQPSDEQEKEHHCESLRHFKNLAQNEARSCRFVCVHFTPENEMLAFPLCRVVHEVSARSNTQAMEVRMPVLGSGSPKMQAAQLAALVREIISPQKEKVVAFQGALRKVLRPRMRGNNLVKSLVMG